ncbi:polysaccharide pyruvyl transferase family protein [Cellulomonas edaphi]|uniref:Polysaccharide pyruvyl transferase family protein n=1 Tax=Cellulomonas edaphi TaxID=3053468 RepID=A0ABT7S6L7_9CELL|nr:polysaccharide pyruvyl transferase family protein [Cellulomons edaphi]MDM7830692.1 polysaccharide pyruvyl transferase family protein [Cellulomons edaphi]
MHVLVLYADDQSSNLGVRALARGAAALADRAFPGCDVSYASYGTRGIPVPVGSNRRLVRARVAPGDPLRSWLGTFDLVLDMRAGDSFADIYGARRLVNQSMLASLARSAGTPVVMGPQTIGPFTTRRGRAVARWSLRKARVVMARDRVSADYAASLGRPVDVRSTDVVFALPRPARTSTRDVVLNVSGLLWQPNPHVEAASYRRTVRAVCDGLRDAGRTVSLMAHVIESPVADNDVPAVRELAALVGGDVEVVLPQDLDEVREVTASAAVVVGSRMHACLNALSTGTPAVPMAYSRKFDPLLRDLGWEHTVDLRAASTPVEDVLALVKTDLTSDVAALLDTAEGLLAPAVAALRSVR